MLLKELKKVLPKHHKVFITDAKDYKEILLKDFSIEFDGYVCNIPKGLNEKEVVVINSRLLKIGVAEGFDDSPIYDDYIVIFIK